MAICFVSSRQHQHLLGMQSAVTYDIVVARTVSKHTTWREPTTGGNAEPNARRKHQNSTDAREREEME